MVKARARLKKDLSSTLTDHDLFVSTKWFAIYLACVTGFLCVMVFVIDVSFFGLSYYNVTKLLDGIRASSIGVALLSWVIFARQYLALHKDDPPGLKKWPYYIVLVFSVAGLMGIGNPSCEGSGGNFGGGGASGTW
jgi:hypothetical protein